MHFHRQRQVIRQMRPGLVPQYSRLMTAGIAQINPIQTQQRKARRIGLCRATEVTLEGFMQIVASGEGGIALQLPVVEVAGDNHRCIIGQGFEQLAQ